MATVIKAGPGKPETARAAHGVEGEVSQQGCGALLEFTRADVFVDHDGSYVVCPSCKRLPYIAASLLKWEPGK